MSIRFRISRTCMHMYHFTIAFVSTYTCVTSHSPYCILHVHSVCLYCPQAALSVFLVRSFLCGEVDTACVNEHVLFCLSIKWFWVRNNKWWENMHRRRGG